MSSVIGSVAKSRAASSSVLHSTSASTPGSRRRMLADALLAEQLLAVAGLGQAVGVEQQQVARVERDLAAVVGAVGVEQSAAARWPAAAAPRRRATARPAGGRPTRSAGCRPSASNTTTHDRHELLGPGLASTSALLSSSRAWAGSRYWRRNTRSRYLAWKAVIDGSMPWPVTSPMTAASRVGRHADTRRRSRRP